MNISAEPSSVDGWATTSAAASLPVPPDQQAELELAYRNHLDPQVPPPCRNQLYPAGAIELPRTQQYTANLTDPDPWTMSGSMEQYNQVRVNDWLNRSVAPPSLHIPDLTSQRYAQITDLEGNPQPPRQPTMPHSRQPVMPPQHQVPMTPPPPVVDIPGSDDLQWYIKLGLVIIVLQLIVAYFAIAYRRVV